eukprot:Em0522g5a
MSAENATCIRDALDLVYELVGLIKYSPKREHLFTQYQLQDSPNIHRLKPLCPTRWTCRTGSINAVIENYAVLQQTLEEIAETCRDEYGRKAAGFQALMGKFSTFFGLKLAHVVFGASEQLSTTLQSKDTTAQDARLAVNLAKRFTIGRGMLQHSRSSIKQFFLKPMVRQSLPLYRDTATLKKNK